jgi:hypothetical protein
MTALLVVNLDENLLKEFRSYAAAKHGRLRNALRPEVESALRNYLSLSEIGVRSKSIANSSVHEQSHSVNESKGGETKCRE